MAILLYTTKIYLRQFHITATYIPVTDYDLEAIKKGLTEKKFDDIPIYRPSNATSPCGLHRGKYIYVKDIYYCMY